MLHSKELPLSLWVEAASTTVHIWNRTVSPQRSDRTPYERMFKQIPDVSYFRVFGSDAYLHIPKKQRSKLEAKSRKLIFVGYDQRGRAYRLWQPKTKRVYIGTDVVIHETIGNTITDYVSSSTEPSLGIIRLPITQQQPVPTVVIPNVQQSDNQSISLPFVSDNSNPQDHTNAHNQQEHQDDTANSEVEYNDLAAHHQGEDHHQGELSDHPQGETNAQFQGEAHAQT